MSMFLMSVPFRISSDVNKPLDEIATLPIKVATTNRRNQPEIMQIQNTFRGTVTGLIP